MKKLLLQFILIFVLLVSIHLTAKAQGTYFMCSTTSTTDTSGTFYDSGGPSGQYLSGENCTLLIAPSCATTITLAFSEYMTESGFDSLHIYDGQTTNDPLVLATSGNVIPGSVTCSSGYMLVVWHTDGSVVQDGYTASWTSVIAPAVAPTAAFSISNTTPPLNISTQFTDQSTGGPTRWFWTFGDGDSSKKANPVHAYATAGTYTITLVAFTCNESDTITHTVTVQAAPQISVSPSIGFTASVQCGDSANFTLNVSNIAGGQLVYSTDGSLVGSIKVLALTYGTDQFQEFPRTIAAINASFTNYTLTTSGTVNPGVLSGLLNGKNVLLIPEHESGNDSVWLSFGPVIRQYLNNGGSVIFLGSASSYSSDLFNTGVFTGSFVTNEEFNTLSISNLAHPLMNGITGTSFLAPSATYSMNITNSDKVSLVTSQGNDVVSYRYFGSGKAIFIAFDYFSTNTTASKIIANAIEWGGQNALPNWIHISPTTGTVNAAATSPVGVTFVASSLPAGTYYANIGVGSNDPNTPNVNVPCTLTVSGIPIVELSDTLLNFGNIMQHTSLNDTVSILNTGCDTLFISSVSSNNVSFTILNGNLSYLLPGAYADLVIKFSSATVDTLVGTISIYNNDVDTFIHVYGITYPAPVVTPSVSSLSQPIRACGATDSTTFVITNSGGSDLSYNIGALPSWISATPTSGILSPGISDTIHLNYGSYSFVGGLKNAVISITSNDPLSPTKNVSFSMSVDSNPCVTVGVSSNTCTGFSSFTTTTINSPTSYHWDFGDGDTSNLPNPTHGFPGNGNFTTTLIACNSRGCDTVINPINAIITGPRATNCYPTTVAYCCGIGITLLQISGPIGYLINNTTNDAIDGYTDYTCTDTASLVTNYPYGINATTGFGYVETVKMWMDLNNDGLLDSISEQLFADSAILTNHTGTFTIPDLPSNAYGSPLRMRIGSDFSGNPAPNPCTNLQFGQYEDYSIFLGYYDGIKEANRATDFTVYPNPFGASTQIEYTLKNPSKVTVEIFNVLGEKTGTPAREEMQVSGKHSYQFKGQVSGIYFIKLTVDEKTTVKRVVKM